MKKTIIFSLSLIGLLAISAAALAQSGTVNTTGGTTGSSNNSSSNLKLNNPLGSAVNTPTEFIGRVLNSLFGVVGSLALVMFIYGGLTWMTSSGNAEKLKKGRDILVWSAIGLFVVFSSYAIVRVILSTIAG